MPSNMFLIHEPCKLPVSWGLWFARNPLTYWLEGGWNGACQCCEATLILGSELKVVRLGVGSGQEFEIGRFKLRIWTPPVRAWNSGLTGTPRLQGQVADGGKVPGGKHLPRTPEVHVMRTHMFMQMHVPMYSVHIGVYIDVCILI